jgi:hypothetical protein
MNGTRAAARKVIDRSGGSIATISLAWLRYRL